MEEAIKQLILKLDHIDKRLQSIEEGSTSLHVKKTSQAQASIQLDPLFKKALEIVESSNEDELPASYLQKQLDIDHKRAESLIDQLVAAGYGTSYMGEV